MSSEDKEWLLNVFPTFIGRTMMKDTLDSYLKAEMLIDSADTKRQISCKCHLRDVQRIINTKYANWKKKNEPQD